MGRGGGWGGGAWKSAQGRARPVTRFSLSWGPHVPPAVPTVCATPPPHVTVHRAQCGRGGGGGRDALEGKGPQRRLDRRLEEVAQAVGGGYCRLRMPLALGVRGTVAGHGLAGGADLPPKRGG